jgi:hypothetical protein
MTKCLEQLGLHLVDGSSHLAIASQGPTLDENIVLSSVVAPQEMVRERSATGVER